jgi:hypothetical protein
VNRAGELSFTPQGVGSWWNRQEEIDVVAVGEDDILVGECKWTARKVGTNILDDLKRKTDILLQQRNFQRVHYALFSRSDFTPDLCSLARDEGVLLIGLEALLEALGETEGVSERL